MQAPIRWILGLLLLVVGWSAPAVVLHPAVLTADQAFQVRAVSRPDAQTLRIHFTTAPGYSLYRERFQFKVLSPSSVRIGTPQFPSSNAYRLYPDGRKMQVFTGEFDVVLPTLFLDPKATTLALQIGYQGCSDVDLCYPEQTRVAQLALNRQAPARIIVVTAPPSAWSPVSEPKATALTVWRLLAFFGMGLLLSFTPCVLPMLPILSSLILGPKQVSGRHAFGLSLSYVLAMAVTYGVIGLVAGLLGSSLQAAFQTPWVLISFTVVIVMMALALFGWFDVELPQFLRQRMAAWSHYQAHGSYAGAAIMGVLSTLILSPCATPALAAAMLYLAQAGQAGFGALALFIMGLGMGVPLLVVGAFGAKLLPKVGAWMNECKAAMAFVLLAVAISMLSRLLPEMATSLLWAALSFGAAWHLGLFQRARGMGQICVRLLALLCFAYGVVMVVKALPTGLSQRPSVSFHRVTSPQEWQAQLLLAKRAQQPILVDIYADWCVACAEMEKLTFPDPAVRAELNRFYLIRVDVTANSSDNRAIQRQLGVIAPPILLFFNPQGQEWPQHRLVGYQSAATLTRHLAAIRRDLSDNPREP